MESDVINHLVSEINSHFYIDDVVEKARKHFEEVEECAASYLRENDIKAYIACLYCCIGELLFLKMEMLQTEWKFDKDIIVIQYIEQLIELYKIEVSEYETT